MRPIIVWDTETTGLVPMNDRIVEIGMMELRCTAPTSSVYSFSSLVNPTGVLRPRAASRIHGITNQMVKEAPSFSDVWLGVLEYVNKVSADRGKPILVAHNLGFDLRFLREELQRINKELPEWDFACSLRDVANVLWPGQQASLAALADRFSIVNEEAHRALCDVKVTSGFLARADLELQIRVKAGNEKSNSRGLFIRELIEAAADRRRRRLDPQTLPLEREEANVKNVSSAQPRVTSLPICFVTGKGSVLHASRSCRSLRRAKNVEQLSGSYTGRWCRICSNKKS